MRTWMTSPMPAPARPSSCLTLRRISTVCSYGVSPTTVPSGDTDVVPPTRTWSPARMTRQKPKRLSNGEGGSPGRRMARSGKRAPESSVAEVASAGEHHHGARVVGRGDDLGVADRAARLDDPRHSGLKRELGAVG